MFCLQQGNSFLKQKQKKMINFKGKQITIRKIVFHERFEEKANWFILKVINFVK